MTFKTGNTLYTYDVEGIDDSKLPTMPLKIGWAFIRSIIFHSAAVGGFGDCVLRFLRMYAIIREGLFASPYCQFLNIFLICSSDLLSTPTALINSVTNANFAIFFKCQSFSVDSQHLSDLISAYSIDVSTCLRLSARTIKLSDFVSVFQRCQNCSAVI